MRKRKRDENRLVRWGLQIKSFCSKFDAKFLVEVCKKKLVAVSCEFTRLQEHLYGFCETFWNFLKSSLKFFEFFWNFFWSFFWIFIEIFKLSLKIFKFSLKILYFQLISIKNWWKPYKSSLLIVCKIWICAKWANNSKF